MIGTEAVRIEVVADRFLRKQIRTLVGTAIIAARDCPDEPRELLARACGGRAEDTAPPAPAIGLCFAEAGYEPFRCLD